MDKSYRVQEDIKCCLTCEYGYYGDDAFLCKDTNEDVEYLGICDKYSEYEETLSQERLEREEGNKLPLVETPNLERIRELLLETKENKC